MEETSLYKKLFGGEIEITIYGIEENLARELIEEAYLEGLRLQKIFNFYDKNSTLSLLNKKRKLKAPEELLYVLNNSLRLCRETKGAYDISLGKEFLRRKSGEELEHVNCSYKDIRINRDYVELLHKDVLIDLGSIAKGYISDKMADFLISKGVIDGMIDSRGDIISFGEQETLVEIQHPRKKGAIINSIKIKNAGVATSGDYNQYNKTFEESHIINKEDYISVTVIAPTLMEADLYATAIFVTPRDKVKALLKNNKNIKAFCIDKLLKIEVYNDFNEEYKNEI